PVLVAVGIARPALWQDVGQAPGSRQGLTYVSLPKQVRLVATNQQDLTGNIRHRRSGESGRRIADVDAVQAPVGRQGTFEEQRIQAEGHRARFDAHYPGEAQDHPLQAGGPYMVFRLGFVCAIEVGWLYPGVLVEQLVVPVRIAG